MSGELPANWTWLTLDDLTDTKSDIVDGPFGSNLKSSHYSESGARVVRLGNIGYGEYVSGDAFIPLDHFETLRKHEVLAGDLLFASLGEDLPRSCLAPKFGTPAIVKADCIRVLLTQTLDPKYVLYATQRPDARSWATDQIHGMGRPRLGLKNIREFPVPVPPIEEQRQIVEILDEQLSRLDAALECVRVVREKAAQFRRSLLHAAFTGELTTPGVDSVPASGWQQLTLNDVAKWGSGGTPKAGTSAYYGGSIPWAVIGDLNDGIVESTAATITPEGLANSSAKVIEAGTVLVAMYGSIGKTGIAGMEMTTNQAIAFARPNGVVIERDYLLYYLQSQKEALAAAGKGGTQKNISQTILKSWPVPVPSLQGQRKIVDLIEASDFRQVSAQEYVDDLASQLAAIRRSLLHAAFRGELTASWRNSR